MDIAHFEIIVKAMLCWSDEPKAPKRTMGRAPEGPRDERDAGEEEAIVDDDDDDDDEPVGMWRAAPARAEPVDADSGEAELSVSAQLD